MHSVLVRPLLRSLLAATLLCICTASSANAQRRRAPARPATTSPPQTTPARPAREVAPGSLPSPRAVLGFTPGDDRTFADWTQIRNYFERLDAASERVRVERVGESTLRRPIIAAYISAPENIRELAKYKDIQRRLADPRLVRSEAERERLIDEGKTVVVVSCSIHSTEVVASQMSMQLAYELAAANDEETLEILRNTILILLPSANPDGNDIIADWYRKTLGTPYEGTEPPELYHHYAGHDNNRDWFMLNLRETRDLTRLLWKEWFPQIVYDVHQQGQNGSRFFIPPFFDPPNPHISPLLLREVGLLGHKVAADLQANGERGVITNAMYDTWWHGGFRTAPYYHNSIGILSEAASARLMSPITIKREDLARAQTRGMPGGALTPATNFPAPWPGGEWHARDIMRIELQSARSILSMAAKYRARYLRNFYELGRRAVEGSNEFGDFEMAYVIQAGQGRDENLAKLIGALVEQGVEVHRMDSELHIMMMGARGGVYNDLKTNPPEVPAGSYIIFLAQPYRANIKALFERQLYPERRTASGEAERPYDVAGWTLPMQMGIQALPVHSIREPEGQRRLTLVRSEDDVRRDLGLPARGIVPGSPIPNPVGRTRRLALYKSWTGSMDEGWTRYVFDTFNVPYKSLRDAEVRAGNLAAQYDVIVIPSMRLREIVEGRPRESVPAEFTGGITDAGVANLRRFVEDGGTLILFDAATELAIKRFDLPVKNVLEGVRSSEFYGPGSILRIEVDTSHPIARGMMRETDAYFIHSAAFEVTDARRVRTVARYADEREVLRSGWLLGPQFVAGKTALAEVSMGRGRIVLFGFRPQHRAQTWGTFPFIFNAIAQ
ncbi:MAG TPA: M14 metallopeptidase family protein [Pyrinomonadaceae bacterium]|nr:M14 metallopeptidase family protein [Pyrinomonadaceae bacterium]